ncbi:VOC family protein [Rhodococcus zopfii]|uniref:VOC family protein n=1 Tax=Rhodococcus zopfii TaxID=43772 RepID=UPI0011112DA1|nr:VOC family protein [Rhodococcus zopfii]
MSRMLFANLPVKDVTATRAFFDTLGFTFNEMFCDANTACMEINEQTYIMFLEEPRFRNFINDDICDTGKAREVLLAFSADSRTDVDGIVDAAIAAGGTDWTTPGSAEADTEFMYGRAFRDLDSHVWEVSWMDIEAAAAAMGPQAEGAAQS